MARSVSPYERFGNFVPETDGNLELYFWRQEDTISGLAYRKYGDWRLWRLIAARNKVVDVRQIAPGTALLIPQKPLEKGKYEIA
jgi:nucleoid-associated protein YgaU